MAGPGMHQTQNLSLQQVLAPQLQQSLLILQAPLLELRNLVQQEMETNPVLEELPDAPNPDAPAESEAPAEDNFKEEFDKLAKLDEEWRDYMAQSSSYSGRSQEAEEKRQFFFDSIPTQETLQQHLMGQLNQNALDADDRKTAELIIGNIDDNGFLQTTPEEMALNTGIPQEDFEHMLTLIQSFHPPGVGAGDLRECLLIQLKREGRQNSLEYKIVADHMQDRNGSEVKDYIRDKIRSGKFLIKSIHQRQQTISNIAHEIVKRQRDFFDKGSAFLKPMTMVQIADAVGVHETTVSRAISGKYMSTPQGVFEMKYFFTPGYQTATGESMSNTSVKEAILDLVKKEEGNAPLSDKEIVEILSKRGIPIARRTVAKYRTELNILPSNMRRRY